MILPSTVLFGLITLLVSLESELHSMARPDTDARILRVTKHGPPFPHPVVEEITHLPNVVESVAVVPEGCRLPPDAPIPAGCWGINRTYLRMHSAFADVPPGAVQRWESHKNGLLVGGVIAKAMHWKDGQPVRLATSTGGTVDLMVDYIADRGGFLWVHSELLDQLRGSRGEAAPIWLLVDTPEHRTQVIDAIEKRFEGATDPVSIWTMEATKALQRGLSGVLILILRVAGIIAAMILFFSLLGMLTLSIEKRRAELATLRAIGWRRAHLATIVIAEAMLLTAPGALLGTALAFLFCEYGLEQTGFVIVHVSAPIAALSIGSGLALGFSVSLVPAIRAAGTNILQALRSP